MTKGKASAASRLPIRRGLCDAEAALYIGIGATKFLEMVGDGRMPRPRLIDGRKVWDIDALDAAFRELPVEPGHSKLAAPGANPWHD